MGTAGLLIDDPGSVVAERNDGIGYSSPRIAKTNGPVDHHTPWIRFDIAQARRRRKSPHNT
jgi:hypothetical protein